VLCEETNKSRRDARLTGTLTAEQRMAVAARIAAVMVFANRYAVWTGPDIGDVSEEDAPLGQCCQIRNVIGSGLFAHGCR
jgi:hypothetical protein